MSWRTSQMNAPMYPVLRNRIPFSKASTLALVRCVAQKTPWQHGACCVSRGVDALAHMKEMIDACQPHLTFWAGPPEAIRHNTGYTHPLPSGYRNWLGHTSCSTSLWPPVSGKFLTLLMWLHFAHSINMKDNPISKIHLREWLNPSTQQGQLPWSPRQSRTISRARLLCKGLDNIDGKYRQLLRNIWIQQCLHTEMPI